MGSRNGRSAAFARELRDLKRRGCAVLVVHCPGGAEGLCANLLGDDANRRRRLGIATTSEAVSRHEPDGGPIPVERLLVATGTDTRSATGTAVDGTDARETVDRDLDGTTTVVIPESEDLTALATLVVETIGAMTGDSPDPGPSELRVCLDTADPLFARTDPDDVCRFLSTITDRVRQEHGMLHCHLSSIDPDGGLTDSLIPIFDVRIDARTTPSGLSQQRWRLLEADIDSGWLEMGAE